MTKTCGTCDRTFSNHNYPSLFYCHECCEYVRFGDDVCDVYKERTDSVEQIAREWALWCGEFDLDAVHFTDRLADLGFCLEALGVEV